MTRTGRPLALLPAGAPEPLALLPAGAPEPLALLPAGVGVAAAAAAAGQWAPSVVSLGQWLPVRSLARGWCRWRGPRAGGRVALTFDDGPCPSTTPAVLDALDRLGVKATFFCLGQQVRLHPDLVAEVAARGHQVETHGYRHAHHLAHSPGWILGDLDASLAALSDAGVRSPRWFHPPYGQVSGPTMLAARRRRLGLVLWSAWGREWAAADTDAVVRRVSAKLAPGAIVLLHDSDHGSPPGSAARALEALDPIAVELRRRGLTAVTLDELLSPSGSLSGGAGR